jgi:L-threonylcarbamoyladenylate synthase
MTTRLRVGVGRLDPGALARAVELLRTGGLVAYPTDTVYGIAADPRSDVAIERLFALKRRDPGTAVPLIASDIEQAMAAGELGPRERRLAEAFWPGPLSIVVPAKPMVSRAALGQRDSVALRVPAHAVARELAAAFGFCITATSANPTGVAPAEAGESVVEILPGVDLVLDAGRAPGGLPSTIVALDDDGPVLVRAGAIAWDRVVKLLSK